MTLPELVRVTRSDLTDLKKRRSFSVWVDGKSRPAYLTQDNKGYYVAWTDEDRLNRIEFYCRLEDLEESMLV